jgi:hypothetical protein
MIIPRNKTTYLIIGLVASFLILVIINIIIDRRTVPSTQPVKKSSFYVVKTTLTDKKLNLADSFSITFSDALSYKKIPYKIIPSVPLQLTLDSTGKILTIAPQKTWEFDTTYEFTIPKDTESDKGEKLDKNFTVKFKTTGFVGM